MFLENLLFVSPVKVMFCGLSFFFLQNRSAELIQTGRNDAISATHTRTVLCLFKCYVTTLYQLQKRFRLNLQR